MHKQAATIVAAARACVGTPFRVQGRVPGLGLDCVGVALCAARAAGAVSFVVPCYSLSGDHPELVSVLRDGGCHERADGIALAGDILVVAPSPARRHLAVVTDRGVVHAHASLRRVVEAPLDPGWRLIAAWRLPEQD